MARHVATSYPSSCAPARAAAWLREAKRQLEEQRGKEALPVALDRGKRLKEVARYAHVAPAEPHAAAAALSRTAVPSSNQPHRRPVTDTPGGTPRRPSYIATAARNVAGRRPGALAERFP